MIYAWANAQDSSSLSSPIHLLNFALYGITQRQHSYLFRVVNHPLLEFDDMLLLEFDDL